MKIAINRPKSEFEIQAEAIALLVETLGPSYIVRGEYTYRGCRFDIAIFRAEDRELVCTLEIKKRGGMNRHHRQVNKYSRATNKPCVLLNEQTLRQSIDTIKRRLAQA